MALPVTAVAVIRGEDRFQCLDRALEETRFFPLIEQAWRRSGKTKDAFSIVVKPNCMMTYHRKDVSTYTDPALVEYLIDRLREAGYRRLAVAEAQNTYGNYFYHRSVVEVAQYVGYQSEGRYRIADLTEERVPHRFPGRLVEHWVGRSWRDADYRISFAKNKTHSFTYFTLTIKNIYGALPLQNKLREYHAKREIDWTTVEFLREFPVHFGLIDAWVSADGPMGVVADLRPNETRTILGGEDLVAVDWVGARKMGIRVPAINKIHDLAERTFGMAVDPGTFQQIPPEEQARVRRLIDWRGDRSVYAPWQNVDPVLAEALDVGEESWAFGNWVCTVGIFADPDAFPERPLQKGMRLLRDLLAPFRAWFLPESRRRVLDRIAEGRHRAERRGPEIATPVPFGEEVETMGNWGKGGLVSVLAVGTLGVSYLEGYLSLFTWPFCVFIAGLFALAFWTAFKVLSFKRLVTLLLLGFLIGYVTQLIGTRSGLWRYAHEGFASAGLGWAFAAVAMAGVTDLLARLFRDVPRERWAFLRPFLPVMLFLTMAIALAVDYRRELSLLPPEFWVYYILLLFGGIVFAVQLGCFTLFSLITAAWGVGMAAEAMGSWSGLWSFDTPYPPLFLILGCWPLEFLAQYALSALIVREPLDPERAGPAEAAEPPLPPLSGREEAFRLLMCGYVLLFGVGSIAFLVYQNLLLDLLNRLAQVVGLPTVPLSTEQFWLALTVSLMVTLTVMAYLVQRNVRSNRGYTVPLMVSKATSSTTLLALFLVWGPLAYLAGAIVDGGLFVLTYVFYSRAA
ncbi:MAG: DUF362 domain-containing protein [Nitrospirae bacterium]|nr:DUF362 domain-containing protein [Nitrospirota bacterium]